MITLTKSGMTFLTNFKTPALQEKLSRHRFCVDFVLTTSNEFGYYPSVLPDGISFAPKTLHRDFRRDIGPQTVA
jgi:hypothetical protein